MTDGERIGYIPDQPVFEITTDQADATRAALQEAGFDIVAGIAPNVGMFDGDTTVLTLLKDFDRSNGRPKFSDCQSELGPSFQGLSPQSVAVWERPREQ